jgi:hypothetical protein
MSSKALRLLLNRSLTDQEFRELLVRQPEEVLKNYNLRQSERQAILSFCAATFKDLVMWLRYLEVAGSYEDLT